MEKMLDIVVVTRKFQVTLTKEVRNRLEIKEGDKIVFVEKDGEIVIRKC
ncbi:AbrB/MazE/SpoVT family DNA-binding domain-containing protein [Archaeoglobales archaeon]|nr:MAG: AbrB/MazE/SpoVT family DNA-binding domain-containing protein [Archaeoglobales archaeon]